MDRERLRALPAVNMTGLLYLIFFLSGAAGLMYESVWSRYLGLFVGHEAYAQTLVLVIFLGGMSAGAYIVSRRTESIRDPLRGYAMVELAVGALALVFHPVFVNGTGWAYDSVLPALGDGPAASLFVWAFAAILILPQSVLLGATFPLMSAGVLRRQPQEPGRVLGWLYFANSLGAALGVLVAGFVLVAWWGLPGVLMTAGVINVAVAGAVLLIAQRSTTSVVAARQPEQNDSAPIDGRLQGARGLEMVLLGAAFLTAVASFIYEIDWIRMLSLVLGSATHSFELMLSAFILGLALGSFWIRRVADRIRDPLFVLAAIQIVMGVLAVATLPIYLESFEWMAWLLAALDETDQGYHVFTLARYGFCLAVMLPATFCAGMTLPLITRTLLGARRGEGAIGRVYALNTLGSIAGVILGAIILLPLLGLKNLLILGGLIDVAVGAALLLYAPGRRLRVLQIPAAAGALLLLFFFYSMDQRTLVSGVFRRGVLGEQAGRFVDYYADGRTATVSVMRHADGFLSLATNGKPDASLSAVAQRSCDAYAPQHQLRGDEVTQFMTGILPLGYLADSGDALVIGLGSGVTTHVLLASPALSSLTTVEIEPRMVDGARHFHPKNRRAFEDPRSRIVVRDARAIFATYRNAFRLVVSEPSNPWVSGVASLYTKEFYGRVSASLLDDGIFAQWLQTYEMDDESVLRVLRAIDDVFPDWKVHQLGNYDLLIVATPGPALPEPQWQKVAALPELQSDLCGVYPVDGATLEATFIADRKLLGPAVRAIGDANSDFNPVLDLRAERRRFAPQAGDGILLLAGDWFRNARQLMGVVATPVATMRSPFAGMRNSDRRVIQTWQTSTERPEETALPAQAAQYEWDRWNRAQAAGSPPRSWRAWLAEFTSVWAVRHAGTSGWVDQSLYLNALRVAQSYNAPQEVLDALHFHRARALWDAPTVLQVAERLIRRDGWVDASELRDVATVAAISLGDKSRAALWLERSERAGRPNDIPMRIMRALATQASTTAPGGARGNDG